MAFFFFLCLAEGQVTGRGCSTKDKVFYKECETHSYGEQVEKMCFCSYFLCNGGGRPRSPPSVLQLIIGATILCVLSHCQQLGLSDLSFCDNTNQLRTKHPRVPPVRDFQGISSSPSRCPDSISRRITRRAQAPLVPAVS